MVEKLGPPLASGLHQRLMRLKTLMVSQRYAQGYGLICDETGRVLSDLIMINANQEHGVVALRPGSTENLPDLPVGTRLRILPNHACATAAQFDAYHVVPLTPDDPLGYWPRFGGW